MHVLVIPSWYPYAREPTSGVFTRDQALAIAELHPDWHVSVFDWGQGELTVPLSVPRAWPGVARDLLHHRPAGRRVVLPNLVELREPTLTWSPRLARGRVSAIVRAARRVLERAERESGPVDLVHAHVAFPGGYVARALGKPYVVTEHMGPFPFPGLLRHGVLAPDVVAALHDARLRIAVSTALAREIELHGVGDAVVVPNVVDERFYTPDPSLRSPTPRIFFLGRLEPAKGLPELLAAAARIEGPFELRVGGRGAYRPAGDARVTWLGALTREQVRDELRRAWCVVLPSRHESFGVVLAEATACGTPVVATRSGGPEDIVTDENGILVPVGDVGELHSALARSLAQHHDPAAIRATFERRFSRPAVVARLEGLYREAVA